MITLNEFHVLPFEKKCDFVSILGTFLMSRKMQKDIVYLYHLGEFFTEIWYDPENNRVMGINAYTDYEGLDLYLGEINISKLEEIIK